MTQLNSETILITGARGKTGRLLLDRLLDQGVREVRAGTSRPADADLPGTTVAFDWSDASTWLPALEGTTAVYVVRPDREDAPELIAEFVALAGQAHVVLLSEQGTELLADHDWAPRVEHAVRSTTENWTILRPSWFDQVLTDERFYLDPIRSEATLPLSSRGGAIAFIDAADIAAVAVTALGQAAANHQRVLTITGPEALTIAQVARILTDELGRPVTAADPDPLEGVTGAFERYIYAQLTERVANGDYAVVTDTVRETTGVAPRPLASFVRDNRADLNGEIPGART